MTKPKEAVAKLQNDYDSLYSYLFGLYVNRTNEKRKLADAILELSKPSPRATLLDLGAGDGSLTRLIAPRFGQVIAVEKNHNFIHSLGTIENVVVATTSMENYQFTRKFDLILASYSLMGVNDELMGSLISEIFRSLTPGGLFLICAHADCCSWDRFAEAVFFCSGVAREGGASYQMKQLEKGGGIGVIRASVQSEIIGNDFDDLYEILSFLFMQNIDSYINNKNIFMPILRRLASDTEDGASLSIIQNIIEAFPASSLQNVEVYK